MARLFAGHPEAVADTAARAGRLPRLLAGPAPLRIPGRDPRSRAARRRRRWTARVAEAGAGRALAGGVPDDIARRGIAHELRLIEELGYAPYFLTVHDIVRFARVQRHPLPGPRLGRQLGRLLLPGRHRGRSRQHRPALRALRHASARRAARHRHRLRARAARGGDPVHLRPLRPRPRRASPPTSSATAPRSAVREVGKALGLSRGRAPAGWPRQSGGRATSDRLAGDAPREPGWTRRSAACAMALRAGRGAASASRATSPPHVGGFVITRGPLCELAVDRRTPPWRTAPSSNGTRTTSTRWAS